MFAIITPTFAQSVCSKMAEASAMNCRLGLTDPKQVTSGGSSGIASGAANLSTAASSDRDRVRDGIKYCEAQRSFCEEVCQSGNPQQLMSPDLKKQCEEAIAGNRLPKMATCSPLVVQIGPEPLRMTDPRDGVNFDIKGANAVPPNSKIAISWLDEKSRKDNYFLALPNARGEILGIDQLFGNHTFGPDPDAPFAENGFEALRKFDGPNADPAYRDGVIDEHDPIFARLRLWHDLNGDGRAQADELVTLPKAGVTSIDLGAAYDPDYFESDVFGNSIRGKSIVTMGDRSLRLIFDVWFVQK